MSTDSPTQPSSSTSPSRPAPAYREVVVPPVSWWVIAMILCGMLALAIIMYVPGPVGIVAGIAVVTLTIAGLLAWAPRIRVDTDGFRVNRNLLEPAWLGQATALDEAQGKDLLGPGGDVRAFLATCPWASGAVKVMVADPADAHPYWVVSTRHPQQLASALTRIAAAGPDQPSAG
ncbi:DUF3093 domain-containing protein [Parenemella sanctibonifatiensis]|nr:DUF3093 domain-containing protein [Parenemella sanctibonifatiensis]